MSAFRFARGFKKETGRSPHQFLLERRVEFAKDLLRSTDRPRRTITAKGISPMAQLSE